MIPLRSDSLSPAADALAAAFMEDPLFRSLVPHAPCRRRWLRALMAANLSALFPEGHVYGDGNAVMGLVPPGRYPLPIGRLVGFLTRVLPCSLDGNLPARSWFRGIAAQRLIDRVHPRYPHWYLSVVGVRPEIHGTGLGRRMIEFAVSLAGRLPLYLETTNPRNLGFYGRFGFEVVDRFPTPGGGGSIWTMQRAGVPSTTPPDVGRNPGHFETH